MANTTNIKISQIEVNKGQIEGLPKNPRFIKDDKFKKLVKSIEENPEMLGYRELLVYPHGGKYIVIGGNMRLRACKELGYKEVPCKVLPQDTTIEQLKAYTIKDNSGFGEWDFDLLANEWDVSDLNDWGLDIKWDVPSRDVHDRSEWKQGEENEEYNDFVDKFAPKLTTDDCYTPPEVYDVVLEWAKEKYNISEQTTIVRPYRSCRWHRPCE